MKLRWRFGIMAGIILALFMLYPQARMIYLRGQQWQGDYAIADVDEVAYAAYLQSLIDGKPRKNDPYTKLSDSPETPLAESLFSIQFAAPYLVAIPARILGISAPAAMIVIGALGAFFAALAMFWIIGLLTDDSLYALAGSFVVLCCGALAGGEGAILDILGIRIAGPFFPGFRRYINAVSIPFFFAFFGLFWLLVKRDNEKRHLLYGVLASVAFGFTVFSYFYTWTTLAAWVACVAGLWLIVRPENWAKDLKTFLLFGASCLVWLIPYIFLLSNRSNTIEATQLLELTRTPDFARVPVFISIAVLIMLAVGIVSKRIQLKEHLTLFTIAFALTPLVVHNQQIITGKSLQPVHYDLFTANYAVILALVLAVWSLMKGVLSFNAFPVRIAFVLISMVAVSWGMLECHFTARAYDGINIDRDKGFGVAKRLRNIGETGRQGAVMSFNMWAGDDLPTTAVQPVLWSLHQTAFGTVTVQESKERYYQHLYYQNIDAEQLKEALRDGDFASVITLFGVSRYTNRLSFDFRPLIDREIDEEIARFSKYILSFNPKNSPKTILAYVSVSNNRKVDMSNVDKWYEIEESELLGEHTLYKVKLKKTE